VSEQIYRIRGVTCGGYGWSDCTPQEIARSEAVEENDGGSAMPIPLDVHRSRTNRCSENISLHLYTPFLAYALQHTQQSTIPTMEDVT
jgi:hypothetical protein